MSSINFMKESLVSKFNNNFLNFSLLSLLKEFLISKSKKFEYLQGIILDLKQIPKYSFLGK